MTDTVRVTTGGTTAVVGDGTTTASRARARWRRWRFPLAALLALGASGALLLLLPAPRSGDPFDVASTDPDGLRALVTVLEGQGVDVHEADDLDDAVRRAVPGTTLVVAPGDYLDDEQNTLLVGSGADLVMLEPDGYLLSEATEGRVWTGYDWAGPSPLDAACADPDAVAAGAVELGGPGFDVDPGSDVAGCFPGDAFPTYVVDDAGSRSVRAVSDAAFMTNARLGEVGNAALALRMLGRHADVVWYVPDADDGAAAPDPGQVPTITPPWFAAAGLLAVLVAAVAAVWRGRRFGPLVTEDLPVVVQASETTRGRGRLYRRAGARGHAAASLRARTARRVVRRLGLPSTAGATDVIDAVSRATSLSSHETEQLLYGPPPADDAALLALARRLDLLESEVHPL